MTQLPFRENLEAFNNPEEVRRKLAAGDYRTPNDKIAQEYLDSIDRKEAVAVSAKLDSRESDKILLAKEANEIARAASVSASAAAAAATAAAASAAEATTLARHAKYTTIAFAIITVIISIIALFLKK